jgi:hypothetical protein
LLINEFFKLNSRIQVVHITVALRLRVVGLRGLPRRPLFLVVFVVIVVARSFLLTGLILVEPLAVPVKFFAGKDIRVAIQRVPEPFVEAEIVKARVAAIGKRNFDQTEVQGPAGVLITGGFALQIGRGVAKRNIVETADHGILLPADDTVRAGNDGPWVNARLESEHGWEAPLDLLLFLDSEFREQDTLAVGGARDRHRIHRTGTKKRE